MKAITSLRPWQYEVSGGFVVRGVYSEPTGKPVLHFIHGNGFCGLTYEKMLAELQDEVDIFISDAQGHGDSDEGGEYAGWDRSARYFAEVWSHFSHLWNDVPRIACGHSYGAVMSTLIMSKQPELFDAGLLLDPTYAPPKLARTFSVLGSLGLMQRTSLARQARVRSVSWSDADSLWEYFHQRGVFKGWDDECLQSYLDHAMTREPDGSFSLKCPPRIEADIFATYPRQLWRAIATIRQPVTMFYGEKTFPFILNSRDKIRRKNPRFDFCEMPGGHCFMQEDPIATAHEMSMKLKLLLSRVPMISKDAV